jgi:hypothetical protein
VVQPGERMTVHPSSGVAAWSVAGSGGGSMADPGFFPREVVVGLLADGLGTVSLVGAVTSSSAGGVASMLPSSSGAALSSSSGASRSLVERVSLRVAG